MADLVVGMAKSVVEGTLTKAQAAIEEEAKLRQSAQRNLVFIAGEFQMMQAFLHVADGERLKNVVVKAWVRQIRDLAYDVEDCIEFVVHLDKRNRWWIRLLKPVRWAMPCLAPIQLDQAVGELDRLKDRVEEVSMRNSRYSLISDSGSKASAAEPSCSDADGGATTFNRLIKATDTQKSWRGDLTQLLAEKDGDAELRVVSVWGTGHGDLGTTSMVWSAYKDPKASFACRAWAKLRHPFNLDELVRSLMAQFYACQKEETAAGAEILPLPGQGGDVLDAFLRHVNERRFLVVLEDLSTMEEWNSIETFFSKQNYGSCIIVTTQQFEIASLCVGYPYHVRHLSKHSDEQSVYAFFKVASQRGGDNPHDSTEGKTEAARNWKKKNGLVGRESAIKDLGKKCCEFSHVMSVWGIAGIGKTLLVKHLFCDKIIETNGYKKYAWVDLPHPFTLWDLCRNILLSFESEGPITEWTADHGTMGSEDPIAQCREMLQTPCFIVVDGVQSTEEWDTIQNGLLFGSHKKTVIVVTSTDERIATHCRGPKGPITYNVKALEPEAASHLFKKVSKKKISDNKMVQELVLKCGGIPKVIVEIAGSMAKKLVNWEDQARSINDRFVQELETNTKFDSLSGLFSWMDSYFRNCPDSLKPCIFYLSIFSPEQSIRRRRLVQRWIAEGYSRDSHDKTAEQNGEEQFARLLNLSIIKKESAVGLGGTRMVSCGVNGFFREYIVSRRMEENLVFELDGSCAPTSQRTGRHLVISEGWARDKIVYKSIDFSKLRSLTVSGGWESFFISEGMKLLRVLDLEDASNVEYSDLKKIVKWFRRLKFLSLRGHTEIYHLPSSVGDLRQLQSVDVRGTSIVTLPVSITELEKLQYIRAGTTTPTNTPQDPVSRLSHYCRGRHLVGVEMPPGIGKLTTLHTLGVVNVGSSGTRTFLEDVEKLTQLRKLGVSGINKRNSTKLWCCIKKSAHLESLSVQFDKNSSESCLDDIDLPPNSLRSLKLYGIGENQLSKLLPYELVEDQLNTINPALSKVTKMDLEMAILKETDVDSLGQQPELCILRLRFQKFDKAELKFCTSVLNNEVDSYKKLKVLKIDYRGGSCLPITFGEKTMAELEHLEVVCSGGSSGQFFGLQNLPQLKEVSLNGPPVETSVMDQA